MTKKKAVKKKASTKKPATKKASKAKKASAPKPAKAPSVTNPSFIPTNPGKPRPTDQPAPSPKLPKVTEDFAKCQLKVDGQWVDYQYKTLRTGKRAMCQGLHIAVDSSEMCHHEAYAKYSLLFLLRKGLLKHDV